MTKDRWLRRSEQWSRLLLRLYPVDFREEMGDALIETYRDRYRVAVSRGVLSLGWVWLRALADSVRNGLGERVRPGVTWRRSGKSGRDMELVMRRLVPEMTDRGGWLAGVGQDLRYAVRGLAKSWTFTLVCLLSLAVGLGINVTLVVFLRATFAPPPGVEAEGAVELLVTTQGQLLDERWSYPDFADVRQAETGMDVTAWTVGTRHLRSDNEAAGVRMSTMYVSANYFRTLQVRIAPGGAFLPEEGDVLGDLPVVVSYDLWQDQLGADSGVIGRSLNLNGTLHRVIGVAPPGFRGHHAGQRVDVWMPLSGHPLLGTESALPYDRDEDWLQVLGRLPEGTGLAQANGELGAVMKGLAEAHPETNGFRSARVIRYTKQGGGPAADRIAKAIFFGLSGLVLLVVCVNIAGMVLVRSAARERELALRLAMGSSRARLVRYLMTESGLLAILGGVLGMVASLGALQLISWRFGEPIPADLLVTVICVCMGSSLATTFVIGLSPALKFSRPGLLGSLKDDAGVGGRRSSRIHRIAISTQTALALPLLVLNGMVLQATRVMDEADYGFEPDNLFVSTIDLAAEGYAEDEYEPFLRRFRDSIGSLAGVESVSIADGVPLDYTRRSRRISPAGEASYHWVQVTRATEGYFEAIGTPILRGRGFDRGDVTGAEPVAVVTESLAERLWPGQNAVGQRVHLTFDRSSVGDGLAVVGVVSDVAGFSHESQPDNLFVSLWQEPTNGITLVVRATSEDPAIVTAVQDMALDLDRNLTRPTVVTSLSLMEEPKREIYMMSAFVGGLSALSLFLVALGVYGVVAFAVTNRTREIGVRMAMGASRLRVLTLILIDGGKLALPGIVVGVLMAAALAQAMMARWYAYLDRTTLDWGVIGISAGIALGVVLFASSVPARRAASVQPMVALRRD